MQFQEVSEAYNVLVKHLDRSTRPTRDHRSSGPFGFHGYDEDDYSSDEYYEEDYSDDEMDFYMYVLCCRTQGLITHNFLGSYLRK